MCQIVSTNTHVGGRDEGMFFFSHWSSLTRFMINDIQIVNVPSHPCIRYNAFRITCSFLSLKQ